MKTPAVHYQLVKKWKGESSIWVSVWSSAHHLVLKFLGLLTEFSLRWSHDCMLEYVAIELLTKNYMYLLFIEKKSMCQFSSDNYSGWPTTEVHFPRKITRKIVKITEELNDLPISVGWCLKILTLYGNCSGYKYNDACNDHVMTIYCEIYITHCIIISYQLFAIATVSNLINSTLSKFCKFLFV